MTTTHENAVREVNWCFQEAFKIAVKLRGVTDWSDQVSREVERYQIEIAKMIQTALHS